MEKRSLLIVEDESVTALSLKKILVDAGYIILEIVSTGKSAVESARKNNPDLILMDIKLEGKMDGIDSAVEIHKNDDIPVIFITANSDDEIVERAKEAEPYGYIIKPFNKRELRTIIALALNRYSLEKKLNESFDRLKATLNGAIQAIAKIIEVRDPYTYGHQRRVGKLAKIIAEKLMLSEDSVESIYIAGSIHDLGKISVPAEILSKPTKLSESEFSLIKGHPFTGYEILKELELPHIISEIVYQHHERVDGSGYPRGLSGTDIVIESRIISTADVVEAMASHRPYRPSLGIKTAIDEVCSKTDWFDREISEICKSIFFDDGFDINNL